MYNLIKGLKMNKNVIISLVAASIALPGIASAAENNAMRFYGRADIGYGMTKHKATVTNTTTNTTILSNKFNGKGILGSIAIGYYPSKEVRTELQFYIDDGLQGKKDGKKVKEKTMAGFINAFYDFQNYSAFTPYLMGGIGYSDNKYKVSGITPQPSFKKKKAFAYQIGLGAAFAAGRNMHFDLGYRLMLKNNAKNNVSFKDGVQNIVANAKREPTHTFLAGVRVTF